MAMTTAFLNANADSGKTLITHIGLVNGSGIELTSGSYARQAVSWTSASGGTVRPTANLIFNCSTGDVVAGWRGFSALSGGSNYGGAPLTQVTFANNGTYTLTAASTGLVYS